MVDVSNKMGDSAHSDVNGDVEPVVAGGAERGGVNPDVAPGVNPDVTGGANPGGVNPDVTGNANPDPGAVLDVHLRGALEAVLMVVDEPVAPADLAVAIGSPEPQVLIALHALRDEYANPAAPRGFELRDVDGRWRVYSSRLYADVVGAFVVDGQSARLSQAALETLAVVAYRQPVTRGQVSQIRGVNVDSVMKTLSARGLITEVGEVSGAVQYGTSTEFLERMGVGSLDDLPPLAPYLPELADVDGEAR